MTARLLNNDQQAQLWGETSLLCWTKITKWQKYSQNTTIYSCVL